MDKIEGRYVAEGNQQAPNVKFDFRSKLLPNDLSRQPTLNPEWLAAWRRDDNHEDTELPVEHHIRAALRRGDPVYLQEHRIPEEGQVPIDHWADLPPTQNAQEILPPWTRAIQDEWMREKIYDVEVNNVEAYFLVNMDPRSVYINQMEVRQGQVAGPLPAFAVIETVGQQYGFWWGKNGQDYVPPIDDNDHPPREDNIVYVDIDDGHGSVIDHDEYTAREPESFAVCGTCGDNLSICGCRKSKKKRGDDDDDEDEGGKRRKIIGEAVGNRRPPRLTGARAEEMKALRVDAVARGIRINPSWGLIELRSAISSHKQRLQRSGAPPTAPASFRVLRLAALSRGLRPEGTLQELSDRIAAYDAAIDDPNAPQPLTEPERLATRKAEKAEQEARANRTVAIRSQIAAVQRSRNRAQTDSERRRLDAEIREKQRALQEVQSGMLPKQTQGKILPIFYCCFLL